jgi:hypothetical protein
MTARQFSEGTASAQRILRDVPLADINDTTRTFHRTMESAFGPGERGPISDTEPMHPSDGLVIKVSGLGFAALLVMAVTGVLQ